MPMEELILVNPKRMRRNRFGRFISGARKSARRATRGLTRRVRGWTKSFAPRRRRHARRYARNPMGVVALNPRRRWVRHYRRNPILGVGLGEVIGTAGGVITALAVPRYFKVTGKWMPKLVGAGSAVIGGIVIGQIFRKKSIGMAFTLGGLGVITLQTIAGFLKKKFGISIGEDEEDFDELDFADEGEDELSGAFGDLERLGNVFVPEDTI